MFLYNSRTATAAAKLSIAHATFSFQKLGTFEHGNYSMRQFSGEGGLSSRIRAPSTPPRYPQGKAQTNVMQANDEAHIITPF